MGWTRRGIHNARRWQARRPISLILVAAGAVILASTGIGCGLSTGTIGKGGSGSSCPTEGVGGDTLPPLCVSQPPPSTSPGITGPVSPSPTQPPSSPGITGPVSVTASTPAAALPQVTAIFPTSGTGAGGTSVTITGSGFSDATAVDFGSVSVALTVDSDTEITVISPPGTGIVDITVITPIGVSATGPADQFSYVS
jgi:hypothetical protein